MVDFSDVLDFAFGSSSGTEGLFSSFSKALELADVLEPPWLVGLHVVDGVDLAEVDVTCREA